MSLTANQLIAGLPKPLTDIQIIQRIHEDANRPEVHERPRDYRAAIARDAVWRELSADQKRAILAEADGEYWMACLALDDIKEYA